MEAYVMRMVAARRGTGRSAGRAFSLFLALAALFGLAGSASAAVDRWGTYAGARVGDTETVPTPIANLKNVITVDASNMSTYALESNGTVWATGGNGRGELGDNSLVEYAPEAVQVQFPAAVKIVAIGEAEDSGFAIDSTGQGWAWGETLCTGSQESLTPEKVPGMTEARAVQGGERHVLWLMKNGTVEACGANGNGQLGVGSLVERAKFPIVVPGLSNVVEVSAGEKSSCARTAAGAVYDWGSNLNGQVGNGEEEQEAVYEPFLVPLPGPASELSCGGDLPTNGTTLALVGGEVFGWGADNGGQIGDEERSNEPTPTATGLHFAHIAAGGVESFGLTASGELYGWGHNAEHSMGVPGKFHLVPVLVTTHVLSVSATANNSMDLTSAP
jgi:alpha-tubulin suppressor-like RCC1 family protein